jgi:hypothetical protein
MPFLDRTSAEMIRLSIEKAHELLPGYRAAAIEQRAKHFAGLPFNEPIRSDWSATRLMDYLSGLEARIRDLCRGHTWYKLLHMSRRIAPAEIDRIGLWSTSLYRRVFSLACMKYGEDTTREDYRRLNPAPDGTPAAVEITFQEVLTVYQIEYLCLELYMVTAALRRVWKRANLVVAPDFSWDTPARPEDEEMMDLYDRRRSSAGNPLSYFGSYIEDPRAAAGENALVLYAPSLNIRRIGIRQEDGSVFSPNYLIFPINLEGWAERLSPIEDAIKAVYGCTSKQLLSFLAAVGQPYWRFAENSHEVRAKFYKISQRAYMIAPRPDVRKGLGRMLRLIHTKHYGRISLDYAEHVAVTLLDRFTLKDRTAVDLWVRRPHALAVPLLDRFLLDLSSLPSIFATLLEDAASAHDDIGQLKGDHFQAQIRDLVTGRVPEKDIWKCLAKVHPPTGERDIDVSFVIGSTLILVECKGVGFPQALEKGDRSLIEARWKQVKKHFEQVQSLAATLAKHPAGLDYSVPEPIQRILPVVCTPNAEYIPRRADVYFLTNEVPRVLTPDELGHLLDSNDKSWIDHISAVPVEGRNG